MNSNIRFLRARALTVSLLLPYRDEMFDQPCRFIGWIC